MKNHVLKKIRQGINSFIDIYVGVPSLAKKLLPMIIIEHVTAAFCLNISAYFQRIDNFNYSVIGQLISVYYWGCLVGAITGGVLTLRFKSTSVSGVGLLILSLCFYLLFSTTNEELIALSMFLLGAVGTCIGTSNLASLVRTAKNIEGVKLKIISLELILFNIAYSFTTFVLLDLTPSEVISFIKYLSISMVVVGTGSIIGYRNDVFTPPTLNKGEQFTKALLPSRGTEFVLLMFMVFLFGLIFSMIKVIFTPTIIHRFGDNLLAVTVASINPWVMMIFQPLIVSKVKASNSVWFLGFGGLTVGIGYFMFGFTSSFALTTIILLALTFGEMMFAPLSKHFSMEFFGDGKEGYATGLWRVVFLGSGTIGPLFSGHVADIYGNNYVWGGCGIIGLCCFISALILHRIEYASGLSKAVLNT